MKRIEDIPGKNPFKVPDSYFEDVNRRIIAATNGENRFAKKPGILLRLRPYILVAASVAGFVILSYTAAILFSGKESDMGQEDLSALTFSESYINDIDLYTLEESAASYDIHDGISGVENSEIINYLMLENIEINEIFEQL
jgi:hypothetical protein